MYNLLEYSFFKFLLNSNFISSPIILNQLKIVDHKELMITIYSI